MADDPNGRLRLPTRGPSQPPSADHVLTADATYSTFPTPAQHQPPLLASTLGVTTTSAHASSVGAVHGGLTDGDIYSTGAPYQSPLFPSPLGATTTPSGLTATTALGEASAVLTGTATKTALGEASAGLTGTATTGSGVTGGLARPYISPDDAGVHSGHTFSDLCATTTTSEFPFPIGSSRPCIVADPALAYRFPSPSATVGGKVTRSSCFSLMDLPDDIIGEILLRIPPDDPKDLVRLSLVCKHWTRVLSDPVFLNNYRNFHCPPMLGFLINNYDVEAGGDTASFIATTSSFRPPSTGQIPRRAVVLDSRHGLVLFYVRHSDMREEDRLLVWDPMTTGIWLIDFPDAMMRTKFWATAVLCALRDCDHCHCHGGPFFVVVAGTVKKDLLTYAMVYSSENDQWSDEVEYHKQSDELVKNATTVLVASNLYFPTVNNAAILEFDVHQRKLAMIESPLTAVANRTGRRCSTLMTAERNDRLGFMYTLRPEYTLQVWSREAAGAAWARHNSVRLDQLRCFGSRLYSPRPIGSTDGVVLIEIGGRILCVRLRSGRTEEFFRSNSFADFHIAVPYASFYVAPGQVHCCLTPPPPA